jgi:hypothetical protein
VAGSRSHVSPPELALLIGVVAGFVAGLEVGLGLAGGLVPSDDEHDQDRGRPAQAAAC